jgi:hypothetical protein
MFSLCGAGRGVALLAIKASNTAGVAPNPSDQHPRLCRHCRLDDEQVKLALHDITSREERIGLVYVIVHGIEFSGAALGECVRSLSVASEERAFGSPHELPPVRPHCIDLFQHDEDHGEPILYATPRHGLSTSNASNASAR